LLIVAVVRVVSGIVSHGGFVATMAKAQPGGRVIFEASTFASLFAYQSLMSLSTVTAVSSFFA